MEAEKKVAFETKKSNSRGVHLVYLLKHDDKLQNIVLFPILKTYFMTQTIPLFFNASSECPFPGSPQVGFSFATFSFFSFGSLSFDAGEAAEAGAGAAARPTTSFAPISQLVKDVPMYHSSSSNLYDTCFGSIQPLASTGHVSQCHPGHAQLYYPHKQHVQ